MSTDTELTIDEIHQRRAALVAELTHLDRLVAERAAQDAADIRERDIKRISADLATKISKYDGAATVANDLVTTLRTADPGDVTVNQFIAAFDAEAERIVLGRDLLVTRDHLEQLSGEQRPIPNVEGNRLRYFRSTRDPMNSLAAVAVQARPDHIGLRTIKLAVGFG